MNCSDTGVENLNIRNADVKDVPLILEFIKALAEYENMLDEVVVTEENLREWLFEKKAAEVLIGELNDTPIGYALYFHNFSTFLGCAGIHLEDLYVRPEARGNGIGKAFLRRLASIAVKRGCGRLEWNCLDWNKPSIDFYLSIGAEPLKDWTEYRITDENLTSLACESNYSNLKK